MSADVHWEVVRAAFQSGRVLQDFFVELKKRCPEEDYNFYRTGIATALHTIHTEMTNRAVSKNPDFKARIDRELQQFGRIN